MYVDLTSKVEWVFVGLAGMFSSKYFFFDAKQFPSAGRIDAYTTFLYRDRKDKCFNVIVRLKWSYMGAL